MLTRRRLIVALMLAIVAVVSIRVSRPARYVSRASLFNSFESDLANLVFVWSAQDVRLEADRSRSMFDFIYQGYDSSVWIPQSLFDGNPFTQAVDLEVGRHPVVLEIKTEAIGAEDIGDQPFGIQARLGDALLAKKFRGSGKQCADGERRIGLRTHWPCSRSFS